MLHVIVVAIIFFIPDFALGPIDGIALKHANPEMRRISRNLYVFISASLASQHMADLVFGFLVHPAFSEKIRHRSVHSF